MSDHINSKYIITPGLGISMILNEFPELRKEINQYQGLLHLQISLFATFTQEAINGRDKIKFIAIYELFRKMFPLASQPLKNALSVSFLEHLYFQDTKKTEREWAYLQMPQVMKNAYEDIRDYNEKLLKK